MAEVPPLKIENGHTKQWIGTADSLRALSIGIGTTTPASGMEIASGDLLMGSGGIDTSGAAGLKLGETNATSVAVGSATTGSLTMDGSNATFDMAAGQSLVVNLVSSLVTALEFADPANTWLKINTNTTPREGVLGDSAGDITWKFQGSGAVTVDGEALKLTEQSGDPTTIANEGGLYTKDDGGTTNLFYRANSDGLVTQLTPASGGGTPGGADTQIQFNNAGAFGGDADLTFDGTSVTFAGALIMAESTNPGGTADQGKLYAKEVASTVTELFYQASDGTVTQLTPTSVTGNTTTETSVVGVVGRKESANAVDATVGALSLRLGSISRGFPDSSRTLRLAALISTTSAAVGAEVDFYNTLTSQVVGTLTTTQTTGPEYVELDVTAKVGTELTDDAVNDIECRIRQTTLDATERAYCDWAAIEVTTTAGGSFLPVPVTGVSGYQDTASATEVEVGAFVLDPTDYPGRTFTFDVLIQTSTALKAVTIDLWNLTDGGQVASSVLTSTSITPDRQTVVLASPADLPASEKVYAVRIKLASAGAGAERAIVKWAAIKIS